MPENAYGLVEMAFVFGLVLIFGASQLWSIEKSRKRLREQQTKRKNED